MSAEKTRKTRTSLKAFFRILMDAKNQECSNEPDKIKEWAAGEANLTVSSFDQKVRKLRQDYPDQMSLIDTSIFYPGRQGRKPPGQNEAWEMLAEVFDTPVDELKGKVESKEEEVTEEKEVAEANHTQEEEVKPKPRSRRRTSKK